VVEQEKEKGKDITPRGQIAVTVTAGPTRRSSW
jgi:hypothetical protein